MHMKTMTKLLTILSAAMLLCTMAGCSGNNSKATPTPAPTETAAQAPDPYADPIHITIEMADGGLIKAELYPNLAPETVKNFTKLVNDKFYNGLIFHRVIEGFMIQGGGFDQKLQQKTSPSIKGEFSSNGFDNELKHTRGVLSMARTLDPDSGSCQFFIMHQDYPSLDGEYAAFGKVTEGMDVVDAIAETEVEDLSQNMQDVPVTPQVIKSITIDK